jgi:KEOPS complex subunit Cgi121
VLLNFIEEFGKYVAVAGFKEIEIEDIGNFLATIRKEKPPDTHIQFFDANLVATWQHLYYAALNALTAFKNNDNISETVAMEAMLYASAQRQISKAIELLGIKLDSSDIAALVITEKPDSAQSALSNILRQTKSERDDAILAWSKKKIIAIRRVFGISDVELQTVMKRGGVRKALMNLVIERMALLATQH